MNKHDQRNKQWDVGIFTWKTSILTTKIKTTRFKTSNLNIIYKNKLHRFVWFFYPKDLLSEPITCSISATQ